MKQITRWVVPVAMLGGALLIAATLMHYFGAIRLGKPGGYLVLAMGSVGSGLCVGWADYAAGSRSIPSALALAVGASLVTAGLVIFILVRAVGS